MISATYIDHMGNDLSVVNSARVSFDKRSEWEVPPELDDTDEDRPRGILHDKDAKLIRYLATHEHWSPFSHVVVKVQCRAPLFIARQAWKSHVGFNGGDAGSANGWNEESRRYVDAEPEFWFPDAWRERAENVKQGSGAGCLEDEDDLDVTRLYRDAIQACHRAYLHMVEMGVAPEQARAVLPMATLVSWTWTGSLAAWARFCKLRQDSHAQREIQDLANQVSEICGRLAPVSWAALTDQPSD